MCPTRFALKLQFLCAVCMRILHVIMCTCAAVLCVQMARLQDRVHSDLDCRLQWLPQDGGILAQEMQRQPEPGERGSDSSILSITVWCMFICLGDNKVALGVWLLVCVVCARECMGPNNGGIRSSPLTDFRDSPDMLCVAICCCPLLGTL